MNHTESTEFSSPTATASVPAGEPQQDRDADQPRQRMGACAETINEATSIRLRAERKLGEILKSSEKAKGGQRLPPGPGRGIKGKTTGSKTEPVVSSAPTLHDLGITKKTSARAQALTEGQRAMQVAALIEDQTEVSKRERARKAGTAGGSGRPKENSLPRAVCDKLPAEPKKDVREAASKAAGVSRRKVVKAQFVRKAAPALAAKVEAGAVTSEAAASPTARKKLKELAHVFTFIEPAHCPHCDSTDLKSYGREHDGGLYSFCKKCGTKVIHHRVKTREFQLD